MVTQVPGGGLTPAEQSLADHVTRGEQLDLAAKDEVIDEAAMRSWGDSRTIRASVVRDILRGQLAADPDPHGLQLRGARITGPIDLENLTTDVNFELIDCLLEEGLIARDAHLASVALVGCQLEHPADRALDAERLTCSVLALGNATITGHSESGAVSLASAQIGLLSCEGASLRNDSGPALDANGLQVDQAMFLRGGFTATGTGEYGTVSLAGAHISGYMDCTGASLVNGSGPALNANSLQVDQGMFLSGGFTATGTGESGAVNLASAHISGQLSCEGASLVNSSGPALNANGLQVDQAMFLRGGFTATGTGESGAVGLASAHIGGQLSCEGASLVNGSGPALNANSLQVDQAMFLRGGFTATGTGEYGAVNLADAHISGQLSCEGASLVNGSGPALNANGLEIGQGMFLRGGFTATGTGESGAVGLAGAHISGDLDCEGASLVNGSGPALNAGGGLQVDHHMFLSGGFTATGTGESGTVNLAAAHIGGQLSCKGASLVNGSGPALNANGLEIGQGIFLRGEFTATGTGESGAVGLAGAHIGGQLDCTGASLVNGSGSALNANSLQVDQGIFLSGGFTATGTGESGTVNLVAAHIGGYMDCTGASLVNGSGPALNANSLQVDQAMLLRGGFTATGAGDGVALDLTGVRVGGALEFDPRLEHTTDPKDRLAVDRLTYTGVPEPISPRDWLRLLRDGTPSYAAQPYQQLAAGYRALGDERHTRETLMAQRDDQLARTHPRWPERWWGRITKVTLGYGYQPWRALLFLAAVVTLLCVLAVVLGSHGALEQTDKTATPGRSCTLLQQASVALDLNLPIGKSVARDHCDLAKESTSVTASWLTAAGWVLQLLAWAFAALFIAGFTSAVRKT